MIKQIVPQIPIGDFPSSARDDDRDDATSLEQRIKVLIGRFRITLFITCPRRPDVFVASYYNNNVFGIQIGNTKESNVL